MEESGACFGQVKKSKWATGVERTGMKESKCCRRTARKVLS